MIPAVKTFENIRKSYGLKTAFRAVSCKLRGVPVSTVLPPPPLPELNAEDVIVQPEVKVKPEYFTFYEEWLEKHSKKLEECVAPSFLSSKLTIAIIADLNLPQCKKYRVLQKFEAFKNAGYNVSFCHWLDQPRAFNIMQCATHYIFYRIPDCEIFDSYIRESRRLGGISFYDIDDPIFDSRVYGLNKGLDFISQEEKKSLLNLAPSYGKAIAKCDVSIASTPGIKALMEVISGKPVILWRNLVDVQTRQAADLALEQRASRAESKFSVDNEALTLGYMSGSRAHEADFREASDDIALIMEKFPKIKFKVVGHLILPDVLEPFQERIEMIPFSDYPSYIRHLSEVDINLLPLTPNDFNECKSAIRYLEASMVNVPSIVTKVGDFKYVAQENRTVLFVDDENSWYRQIDTLIRNNTLRNKLTKAANDDVNTRFLLDLIPKSVASHFSIRGYNKLS